MWEPGINSQDVTHLRDLVALSRSGGGEHGSATETTFELLGLLQQLMGADFVSFQDMRVRHDGRISRSLVQDHADGERDLCWGASLAALDRSDGPNALERHWWQMPCSESDRTGRAGAVSLRRRFTAREWANHPVHVEYLAVEDEIVLAYPCGGGRSLRILLGRESGRPFGLRELTLTDLLLPHLRPVLDAGVAEVTDPGRAGRPHESVTTRQREILHLVALGMPNKQVARHLGLSEGTVRKHLENLYARLGVQSRTEAVLWLHSSQTTAS